jgi:protoporphyrinogen/coproporphyrinogen III oxidase
VRPTPAQTPSPPSPPGMAPSARLDLAVLGGGISGLALAAFADRAGLNVAVFERAPRPGGVMDSFREDKFLFERGPNTVLDRDPSLNELIQWAGLDSRTLRVPLRGLPRYIWHRGRLNPVPASPLSAIRTPLLSLGGKLRLLREPWIAPVREDESLEAFVVRRLGRELYERALVPMVSGVSGGDPARMSVEFSFPVLKALEREGGSLVRGMLARRRQPGAPPRPRPNMVSFPDGLGELPRALATRLGERYRGGIGIESIAPLPGGGFRIETTDGTREAGEVALCADAGTVARWVAPFAPEAARRLDEVHYCPLLVLGLGVPASSLRLLPGFGFLTTADSELRIVGAIFNSGFFPGRAPEGAAALTVMLGTDRDPEAAMLDGGETMDQVRRDLGRALDWNGEVTRSTLHRWEHAIPQYGLGHKRLLAALENAESRFPGLHFFGNWRGGAAVGERIRLAREWAGRAERKYAEKSV